jgi:hypothetical protein
LPEIGRQIEVLVGGRRFHAQANGDGLDIEASIEKSIGSEPNRAEITIVNVNESTASQMRSIDLDELVELSAGVGDQLSLIFRGSPVEDGVTVNRSGTNYNVVIEASDGGYEWRATRINTTLSGQTSAREIVDLCVDKLDVPVRRIEIPDDFEVAFGAVLAGPVKDILDRIADSAGVRWSIQDGEFLMVPDGENSNRTAPLFSLSNNTLISANKKRDGSVKVTAVLTDPVSPGDPFKADGQTVDGFFRADKVDISISSGSSSNWQQTLQTGTDTRLIELLRQSTASAVGKISVAGMAEVQDFRRNENLCDLTLHVSQRVVDEQGKDTFEQIEISEVPVLWPQFGGFSIVGDIERGDDVLVIFADRSHDEWVSGRGPGIKPRDLRRFDFSDALALPVGKPPSQTEPAPDGSVELRRNSGAFVRINDDGTIAIGTDSDELVSIGKTLVEALQSATVATALGPQPLDPNTQTTLSNLQTKLDNLKE